MSVKCHASSRVIRCNTTCDVEMTYFRDLTGRKPCESRMGYLSDRAAHEPNLRRIIVRTRPSPCEGSLVAPRCCQIATIRW